MHTSLRYDPSERERLAYRLLEGEQPQKIWRDDVRIVYSRMPADQQPARGTVVLLHGVASNGSRWEEFVETTALRAHYDLVRMDLRGHGASVCSARTRLEDWSEDLLAMQQAMHVDRLCLIGHSLGAHVAMHFAAHHPDKMQALVLLDPLIDCALTAKARRMRGRVPFLKAIERVVRMGNALGCVRTIQAQNLRQMDAQAREKIARGGKELQDFIEQYSSASNDLRHNHSAPYVRDLIEVGRPAPEPTELTCPTLVIGSTAGTFTEEAAMRAWVARMPQGHMQAVQCAHWPMTECPQDVSAIIEQWLDQGATAEAGSATQPVGQART